VSQFQVNFFSQFPKSSNIHAKQNILEAETRDTVYEMQEKMEDELF